MAVVINKWKLDHYSVREHLHEIPTCVILETDDETTIKDLVTKELGSYVKGLSFYELVKQEKVQAGKLFAIRERSSGSVFSGLNTREFLEIPEGAVTVNAFVHPNYEVYVQSTSPVRKITWHMKVLVLT